ncbi:alpha/beta hydrolase [Pontiella sulfatireligans]|uniref:Monoacylglycerol lipase n=1 Tax=Pontiella sulfatireligans TaxID=2750658 RepID=A0A6C2UQU3_9BACT|nr:alpha/beta hydrolase [Pontiella sulfatireligans]VGO21641.1 Monoacylglycerol lipase [Pontiella sulfatireligans]
MQLRVLKQKSGLLSWLLLLASTLLTGCHYFRNGSDKPNTSGYDLEQVKKDLKPLDLAKPYQPTEAIAAYFSFYGLNPANAQHYFGTVESEGQTLAAHVFMPENPRGTLFLLHGYFDHTGTLSKLIAEALARRYAVASWDLPGHGLTTGGRTETGDFDRCAKQHIDIVERAESKLPRPFDLVAHSTGCSIAIEYMYNAPTNAFEKIVFLAPLVKHAHWGWGKFGHAVGRPFTKHIRRRDMKNSSDEAYLAFVKKDPLHSGVLSFQYLEDLYEWEARARGYPRWPGSLCIIQGDADIIVDWRYNVDFLGAKVEHAELYMVPGANHQLANEPAALRKQAFELIFNYLGKQ